MNLTAYYGLKKPQTSDLIADTINLYIPESFDIIDAELKKAENHRNNTDNPHSVTAALVGALPVDGKAVDSDKLDGRDSVDFAYSETAGSADLNTVIQSGMYRINADNPNMPAGVAYGQLLVIHGDGDTITQIISDFGSDDIYWRSGNPTEVGGVGTWQPWRKIWHDGNDGDGSGLDADTVKGYVPVNKAGDEMSGLLVTMGLVGKETNAGMVRVLQPEGAICSVSSTATGAIKITLPNSWTNTMMHLEIQIFDYAENESVTVYCGGYTYSSTPSWNNCFAYILASSYKSYNIRFGHDGSKCCIYIGETDSVWGYPKVAVTSVIVGHSNYDPSIWNKGWSIDFVTSFGTIYKTLSNCQVGRYINGYEIWHSGNDGSGSGLDADTVDGHHVESLSTIGVVYKLPSTYGSYNVFYRDIYTGDIIKRPATTSNRTLYRYDKYTGEELWQSEVPTTTEGYRGVCIGLNYIIAHTGSNDDMIAFNKSTGAKVWELNSVQYVDKCEASDNYIYYYNNDQNKIQVRRLSDGALKGTTSTSYYLYNNYMNFGREAGRDTMYVCASTDSGWQLIKLNYNASVIWDVQLSASTSSLHAKYILAVNNDECILYDKETSELVKYTSSGSVAWTKPTSINNVGLNAIYNTVVNNKLYSFVDGRIYVYSLSDGSLIDTIYTTYVASASQPIEAVIYDGNGEFLALAKVEDGGRVNTKVKLVKAIDITM